MSPVEDIRAANDDRRQLEDAINSAIYAMNQALHFHRHMDHEQASIFTDQAKAHLHNVSNLEDGLVDYQGRAEGYPEHVLEGQS